MGSYMDNLKRSPIHSPKKQDNGSYVLSGLQSPKSLEPFVDTVNDTGKFVEAMEKLGPGKKVFGVSDLRTEEEFVRIWCDIVGVEGGYQQIPIEKLQAMIRHKDLARELVESRGFNADFGWNGGEEDVLMPRDVSLLLICPWSCSVLTILQLGIKTTTLEEYLSREGWAITGEKE